jgi:Uma2 family endonuclease
VPQLGRAATQRSTRRIRCISSRMQKKVDEYLAFGVSYVWLVDPYRRSVDVYTGSQIYAVADSILRTEDPAIEVPLAELFNATDQ